MHECDKYCFANVNGKCKALTPTPKDKCPFQKTPEQVELERKRTEQRLRHIGGIKK